MKLDTIHTDGRGSINLLLGDLEEHEEVTIFKTNKGYARGGCIHEKSEEYCCIIEGMVEYVVGSTARICRRGDIVYIPKNTPHYYITLENSVVIEWGANPEEKKEKHLETRKIVDEINANEKLKGK